MRARGMKLDLEHLTWFYSIFSILFLSGLIWIGRHYLRPCNPEVEICSSSVEPALLKIHGAAAMAYLILFGSLIPIHIRRGWSAKINRGNGAFLIVINLTLIVSGYGLYYGGSEGLRFLSHWVHVIIGVLLPVFLVWHIKVGRKGVKRRLHSTHEH